MITVAMVAFLVVEARSVLTLWLGHGFEGSVVIVQILAIGYLLGSAGRQPRGWIRVHTQKMDGGQFCLQA